jgi:hypothetical protein
VEHPSPRKEETHRHRQKLPSKSANGRTASVLCVGAALLGFAAALTAELLAMSRNTPPNLFISGLAGVLALAALLSGGYAQAIQRHRWSRHVRNRLLVGFPAAALTLLVCVMNFCGKRALAVAVPLEPESASAEVTGEDEDTALFKPGWYGERLEIGVMVIVSSFAENAAESRAFNRFTSRPVSYAALTLINQDSPIPVALSTARIKAFLDTGEEVQSLNIIEQLKAGDNARRLIQRLAGLKQLTAGAMAADIPVCLPERFDWTRVQAVKITLESRELIVPGRMMTADEKRAWSGPDGGAPRPPAVPETTAVPAPAGAPARPADTNRSSEAWFKDL